MKTKERLADALKQAGAPEWMVLYARNGGYDDYESQSATPCVDLCRELERLGYEDLKQRAMNGEFDATKEESDAWAAEMKRFAEFAPLLKKLGLDK